MIRSQLINNAKGLNETAARMIQAGHALEYAGATTWNSIDKLVASAKQLIPDHPEILALNISPKATWSTVSAASSLILAICRDNDSFDPDQVLSTSAASPQNSSKRNGHEEQK